MVTWLHIEYVFWNRMAVYCAQYARYTLHCVQCAFKLHCFEPPMSSCGKTINSLFINCKIEEVNFTPKFQCIVNGFWKIASYNTVFNATQLTCFVNGKRVFDVNVQLPEARVKTRRGLNGKIFGWEAIFEIVKISAESAAFSRQCEYNFKWFQWRFVFLKFVRILGIRWVVSYCSILETDWKLNICMQQIETSVQLYNTPQEKKKKWIGLKKNWFIRVILKIRYKNLQIGNLYEA